MLALTLAATGPHSLRAALALEQAGDDQAALSAMDAVVRDLPGWELPRIEAARLRLKLGRELDRASFDLDIARTIAPENPRTHYFTALAFEEAKADEAAIRSYRLALALRPTLDDARLRLAGALFANGALEAAEREYALLANRRPEWTHARLQWAATLESLGRMAEAEAVLVALRQADAASVVVIRRLAELYERAGRAKEAGVLRALLEPKPVRKLRPLPKSRR